MKDFIEKHFDFPKQFLIAEKCKYGIEKKRQKYQDDSVGKIKLFFKSIKF